MTGEPLDDEAPQRELTEALAEWLAEAPVAGAILALIHEDIPLGRVLASVVLERPPYDPSTSAVWWVAPPRVDQRALRRGVEQTLRTGGAAEATLLDRLVLRAPADAGLGALIELLEQIPPGASVILGSSELYHVLEGDFVHARNAAPGPLGVPMGLHQEADLWMPSACALAEALRPRVSSSRWQVFILVGKRPPAEAKRLDALERFVDGVFTLRNNSPGAEIDELPSHLPGWRKVLADEGIDALRAVLAASIPDTLVRAQIEAQCLYLSGRWEEAYRTLEPKFDALREGPPAMLLTLLFVSLYSGHIDEAHDLIKKIAAADLVDEGTLRNTHKVTLQAEDALGGAAILARMRADYPRSLYLLRAELLERFDAKDFATVVALGRRLSDDPELPTYRHFIERATYRHANGSMTIDALLHRIRTHSPEHLEVVLAEAVEEALADRRFEEALGFLAQVRPLSTHAGRCAMAGCDLLKALALDPSTDPAKLAAALGSVVRILSERAHDVDIFAALVSVLSMESMGSAGTAMLVAQVLHVFELSPTEPLRVHESRGVAKVSDEDFMAFLGKQYVDNGPKTIVIRPEMLHLDLSQDDLWEYARVGLRVLCFVCWRIVGEESLFMPTLVAKAVLDLWHTASARGAETSGTLPIEVWAMLGQGCATAGLYQRARDFAGMLLTYAGSHAPMDVKRCGWIAHADLQLRAGHVDAALVGVLCARAQPLRRIPLGDRYNELDLHIRLLRTVGLYELALANIAPMRATLEELGNPRRLVRKIDDLETGLRLMQLPDELAGEDAFEIRKIVLELVAAACRSLEYAIETNEEILIPTNLLGNLLHRSRRWDIPVPPEANALFERGLAELPDEQRPELRAAESRAADATLLLQVARAALVSRGTSDLGARLDRVQITAHDLLDGAPKSEDALLAIELLCDPSVEGAGSREPEDRRRASLHERLQRGYHFLLHGPDALPGAVLAMPGVVAHGYAIEASAPIYNTVMEPQRLSEFATSLSADDWEIVAMAIHRGRIVHVSARAGRLVGPQVERPRVGALQQWRAALLRLFFCSDHADDSGLLDTEGAMGELQIIAPPVDGKGVLFVLAPPLVMVPGNLILRNCRLSGVLGPVATLPSLSWLLERRRRPSRWRGRRAWILPPDAGDAGEETPLALLADKLPECLPGFVTELTFPRKEVRCEVALLAAHGDIDGSGLCFRAVEDEGSCRFSIADVATAMGGCEVVILFICSAGRSDPAPFSGRSVGLPTALLAAGCRTVIASPWALDAFVALAWIPLFLDEWRDRVGVARAVHRANMLLAERFAHPRDFLAMHVFGDPDLRPDFSGEGLKP